MNNNINNRNFADYFSKLQLLAKKAYAPYSNFQVSCLLLTADNLLIPGVNVENQSYGATICAERSAICQYISLGHDVKKIKHVFLYANHPEFIWPCGVCCQVLLEFLNSQTLVTTFNNTGKNQTIIFDRLLPLKFNILNHS